MSRYVEHAPCCGACTGSGVTPSGEACWDCRGTGCAHPAEAPSDVQTEWEVVSFPPNGADLTLTTTSASWARGRFERETERGHMPILSSREITYGPWKIRRNAVDEEIPTLYPEVLQ